MKKHLDPFLFVVIDNITLFVVFIKYLLHNA